MVKFELSNKKYSSGRRPIKVILHEIHESTEQYNNRGITWKEDYVSNNLHSIVGSSITCEFINEERTEILGHGETGIEDSLPIFANASMIGVFEKGYIDEIEVDGEPQKVVIAEGYIDEMRYKNFVKKLESELNNGNTVSGSVEIIGLPDNENKITYEDGWKPQGRVPVNFLYSGWAMLSIRPASPISTVVEMNNDNNKNESEEIDAMDEKILAQFVDSIKSTITEVNSKNSEYETKIGELDKTVSETNASVESLQTALDEAKAELGKKYEEIDALYKELELLRDEVAKAKMKERVGELNSALADFTDDEKAYAKDEISAFEADPINVEINSVINKISVEIVRKAKEAKKISEINSANQSSTQVEDIFSDIYETNSSTDDDNIF